MRFGLRYQAKDSWPYEVHVEAVTVLAVEPKDLAGWKSAAFQAEHEAKIREAIEVFERRFFDTPLAERQARWNGLQQHAFVYPRLRARLERLQPGIAIDRQVLGECSADVGRKLPMRAPRYYSCPTRRMLGARNWCRSFPRTNANGARLPKCASMLRTLQHWRQTFLPNSHREKISLSNVHKVDRVLNKKQKTGEGLTFGSAAIALIFIVATLFGFIDAMSPRTGKTPERPKSPVSMREVDEIMKKLQKEAESRVAPEGLQGLSVPSPPEMNVPRRPPAFERPSRSNSNLERRRSELLRSIPRQFPSPRFGLGDETQLEDPVRPIQPRPIELPKMPYYSPPPPTSHRPSMQGFSVPPGTGRLARGRAHERIAFARGCAALADRSRIDC